jgi:hypothetical protein
MAGNNVTAAEGNPAMDYDAHFASYHLFTSLFKWGTIFVILVVLLLAYLTL